jgi:hypothetical protein
LRAAVRILVLQCDDALEQVDLHRLEAIVGAMQRGALV